MRGSRTSRVVALALFALVLSTWAGDAGAQRRRARRVIVLDSTCDIPPPPRVWELVVAAPARECPGAVLLEACGEPARDPCPEIAGLASELGDRRLDTCAPGAELLFAAEALRGVYETRALEQALRLYRALSGHASLGPIARARAMETAWRLSRYGESVREGYELLALPGATAYREAAMALLVAIVTYEDHDEDMVRDDGFPATRLTVGALPDATWAHEVARRAVLELARGARSSDVLAALEAARARWPDLRDAQLDRAESDALAEMDPPRWRAHARAAAERCAEASCAAPYRRRLRDTATQALRSCGLAGGRLEERAVVTCEASIEEARHELALEASEALAADVERAAAWATAARAQLAARASLRSRVRAERTEARRVLALPLPPDVVPTLPREPVEWPDYGRAWLQRSMWARTLDGLSVELAACRGPSATVVEVHAAWSPPDRVTELRVDPAGTAATCVRRILDAHPPRVTVEDAVEGHALFFLPPR